MGQLERYGLYVLCLVIFLILGVAIWGGDPQPASAGGGDLTKDLERLSNPPVEAPAQQLEAAIGGNAYMGEFLELNNEVPRTETSPPPAARTELEEALTASTSPATSTGTPGAGVSGNVTPGTRTPVTAEAAFYVVKKGDMLTEISKRELGTRNRWKEIEALNPGIQEKALQVGMKLRMPPRGETAAPQREWFYYVVKKNDNFSTISSRLYGTQKYWKQIQDLNPRLDPKKLQPGSEIRVPLIN